MEIKNQGKVHPSPSSSSSSAIFKLLPSAILALVSVLSLDEREVLAYMITRSMKSTSSSHDSKNKSTRKAFACINGGNHKTPMFDCDCFSCYTSYWCRWDSSPNRDLIHHAIEAFEDLTNADKPKKNTARGRRRDRPPRQASDSPAAPPQAQPPPLESEVAAVAAVEGSEIADVREGCPVEDAAGDGEKGLATKVLPDVFGFFNSRLWSLWSPNL